MPGSGVERWQFSVRLIFLLINATFFHSLLLSQLRLQHNFPLLWCSGTTGTQFEFIKRTLPQTGTLPEVVFVISGNRTYLINPDLGFLLKVLDTQSLLTHIQQRQPALQPFCWTQWSLSQRDSAITCQSSSNNQIK